MVAARGCVFGVLAFPLHSAFQPHLQVLKPFHTRRLFLAGPVRARACTLSDCLPSTLRHGSTSLPRSLSMMR